MKKLSMIVAVSALSVAVLTPVFALQNGQHEAGDYTVTAYKDCDIVYQQTMTHAQFEAYQALKQHEAKMQRVEMDLHGIEEQLEDFTSEIEELTSLAIQETEDSLFIDKRILKQQEASAQRLEEFMAQHEHIFEALGEYGAEVGESAEKFTDAIESDLAGIDYDNIRINDPEDQNYDHKCGAHSGISFM